MPCRGTCCWWWDLAPTSTAVPRPVVASVRFPQGTWLRPPARWPLQGPPPAGQSGRLRLLSSRRCPHTRHGTARGYDCPRLFSRSLFVSTRPRVVIHSCVIYSRAQIVPALAAGTLLFGSRVPSNVPVILYMYVFGFCTERSSGLISCMSCPGSRISRVSGWGAPVGGGVGSGAGCARCCRGVGACRPSRPAWRGDECECERA